MLKFMRSNKMNILYAKFRGLVSIVNGLVTEEITPKSKVFEKYDIIIDQKVRRDLSPPWMIIRCEDEYLIEYGKGYLDASADLKLTTRDLEIMEIQRDRILAGSAISE